ncbi:MAG TPA: hypothetical protein PLI70_00825 [Gemmatimonadales bacterium]|nr:hypothetical protein [Gemmatimonadales bacterium]
MLRLFILLTVIISQLHLLRNVTPLYALVYASSVCLTFLIASLTATRMEYGSRRILGMILGLYGIPILAILPGLVSGAPYTSGSLALGTVRLIFTIPIYVVVLWLPGTQSNLRALTVTAALFSVLAALTIPYQFVAGPISWFAESSERAGLFRFASLFGSLTTLGAVCGMGMILCVYSIRPASLASIAVICIAVGSMLSLSKGAIVNVALALLVLPLVRRPTKRHLVVLLGLLTIGFLGAFAQWAGKLSVFWRAFRLTDQSATRIYDDVSLAQSILDRLTALPRLAIAFHGKFTLLLGLGPIGGAGNLGYPEVPTPHNGLVELLLMGGVPLSLWYLWLNERAFRAGIARASTPEVRGEAVVGLYILGSMFLNMMFGSGILFSPAGALFFAIGLKLVSPGLSTVRRAEPSLD